jgi:carbon storage regulator
VIGGRPFSKEVSAMLVLSRKVGEEIIIGDNIRVRVLSIHGNQIRLGFVAPRDVQIHRDELLDPGRKPRRQPDREPPQPDTIVENPPPEDQPK